MQYPGFPDNRLIVDGVDLTEEFKLILVDEYELDPPEPKKYTVDIPGGNGILDLTEALYDDVVYENRSQRFKFYVIIQTNTNFETVKTKVSNFLHGREADYQITFDPGYTYHGRFSVTGYEHQMYEIGVAGVINVSVNAQPYKYKKPVSMNINAIAGNIYYLESGRKPVIPTIQTDNICKIIFNKKVYRLYTGQWTIHDIVFRDGLNKIYLNNYEVRNMSWKDLNTKSITWGKLKTKKIFEWYRYGWGEGDDHGSIITPINIWDDFDHMTWDEMYAKQLTWDVIISDPKYSKHLHPTYITYEWGDL